MTSISSAASLTNWIRPTTIATTGGTAGTASTSAPSGPPSGPPPAGAPPAGGHHRAGGKGGPDLSKLFAAADTDGDGTVSSDEAKALQTKINDARSTLLSIQEGSDGTSATAASDATDITDLFSRLDGDGDGNVSKAELTSAEDKIKAGPPPGPPPSAFSGGSSSDSSSQDPSSSTAVSTAADRLLKLLDTSGDGTIAKDEISMFLQSMTSANGTSASAAT